MQLFQDLFDRSKQLNQAPCQTKLAYHAQKGRYKIIHQALMIPDLPAPLHYFNFSTILGQPNVPMLRNPSAIKTTALDTVAVMSSVSAQMLGQFNSYSLKNECQIRNDYYQFGGKEVLSGAFPEFRLQRQDSELSVDLKIVTKPIISHFTKLKLGMFEHWSLLCQCEGIIQYKQQIFQIHQMGAFEYARGMNIPYLPLCFFTYQMINLKDQRQLLLAQLRNNFNQIIQSRIYLRDSHNLTAHMFDENVYFKVHRVYPKITTPNNQDMYLPREFEWTFSDGKTTIQIQAQSRGDFKFGVAAGYVGSFTYQLKIDGYEEEGTAGYCEYIDCRPLKWQEKKNEGKSTNTIPETAVIALKDSKTQELRRIINRLE